MKAFDFDKPILVLAPHLVMPPRNGADLLVDRSARWMSTACPEVTVLGAAETIVYRDGTPHASRATGSGMRSRGTSAARTLAMRSHYYRERFLTASFRRRAAAAIGGSTWGGIVCSYLTTAELTEGSDIPVAIWTHNDEFQWFEDLNASADNTAARLVASQSLAYLGRNGGDLAEGAVLMHVSQEDAEGFGRGIGDHRGIVVPIGTDVDVPVAGALPPSEEPPNLLFVGSLSVQMNADALRHFGTAFYPQISTALPGSSVVVAGSNPSPSIRAVCDEYGWDLVANPTDQELDALYMQATFSILPFPYATGAKLKLLASLAHGVPYLATELVDPPERLIAAPCLVSNDPEAWSGAAISSLSDGIPESQRRHLRSAAEGESWEASTRLLVQQLGS